MSLYQAIFFFNKLNDSSASRCEEKNNSKKRNNTYRGNEELSSQSTTEFGRGPMPESGDVPKAFCQMALKHLSKPDPQIEVWPNLILNRSTESTASGKLSVIL